MQIDCGRRQKSSKEMSMNYEVLFAGAQNQLHVAKISRNITVVKSIDFMLNTGTPSLVSKFLVPL